MKEKAKLVGLDEAGRGPLAGPVVAAAVKINRARWKMENIGIKDSKKITPKLREKIYEILVKSSDIEYGVGVVSEKVIDKINILEATKLAMKKALETIDCSNVYLIIDGNFAIDTKCKQEAVVRADESILECSMASIIAKVKRDRIMESYHIKYPCYEFNKHKGYGTKKHRKMIRRYGICPIHRKSFKLL